MKKLLCILTAICILAMTMGSIVMANGEILEVWDGTTEAPVGSGTAADPYLIANGKNLAWLSDYVDALGENDQETKIYSKQTNHILMNSDDMFVWEGGRITAVADGKTPNSFNPIGSGATSGLTANIVYHGEFDGNGYEIRNLYISSTAACGGLFSAVSGTIENVKIASGYIKSGQNTGSIVGNASGWGSGVDATVIISNCYSAATVVASGTNVGGIAGLVSKKNYSVTVEGCVFAGSVTSSGKNFVGGIAGNLDSATINNCLNVGAVNGKQYVGGLVGVVSGSFVITNSLCASTSIEIEYTYGGYPLAGQGPAVRTSSGAANSAYKGTVNNVYAMNFTSTSNVSKTGAWRCDSNYDANGNKQVTVAIDGFTGGLDADVVGNISMAYTLNGGTADPYENTGAWTYNTGDAYPTLATSTNGGVYKFGVTNGEGNDVIANDYLKSTTGAAKLIVAKNNGQIANVINVNLKTMNTQDIAATLEGDSAKVMLWDGFETLIPIVQAENVQ